METNDNQALLENAPVSTLIRKMSVPSIIGVMAYNLYNLFDTIFISRGAGSSAVGGVAVSFPLFLFLSAVSSTLGSGAASVMSRAFGRKDYEKATKTAANTFLLFYITAILVTILGLCFLEQFLYAMGVTDTLLPYAKSYTRIILAGAVTSTGFSSLIRAEGSSRYAMYIWVIPMSANILLDILFIFGLRMGVIGAAAGTVMAQAISMFMSIYYFFLSGKSCLKFSVKDFIPDKGIIREVILIGIPSFLQMSGYSISIIIVNQFLRKYGGDLPISTYGIVSRVNTLFLFPVMGLVQGIQPIIGYSNGAGKPVRTAETLKKSSMLAVLYGACGYLVILLFSSQILRLFTTDEGILKLGSTVLKLTNAGIILNGLLNIQSAYFQAVGKKLLSLFLVLCNQVICFIPITFLLGSIFGLSGIWYSFPVSALLASVVSGPITVYSVRKSLTFKNRMLQ